MKSNTLDELEKIDSMKPLFCFYKKIYKIFYKLNIEPIIYGSLAYFYYTKDKTIPIKDIDLLVPESNFICIQKILDSLKNITYKVMPWHSIEVFENGMKIDIDSIEHFLDPRPREFNKATFGDLNLNFLNRDLLINIYEEALLNMPKEPKLDEKRKKYQKKLENLKMQCL